MKRMTILAAALIISAALLSYGGCSSDDGPVAVDGTMSFADFQNMGYGPDTLTIYSGADTCGGTDENITVTVPPLEAIWPALVGGGGLAPDCGCDVTGDRLPNSMPVTTHDTTDSLGIFETAFSLPNGISGISMNLKVIADDGAMIYLNDTHIGTASINGGVWERMISVDSLFNYAGPCPPGGEPCSTIDTFNLLRFELVNTGTGDFGEPVARADTAD